MALPGNIDPIPIYISLKTATTASAITFILGVAAARCLVGVKGRTKSLLDGILILPLVLPPTVVGLGLLLIFGRNGPIGQLLEHFGTTVIFSWSATVIAAVVVSFPLMYQTARGAFEQVDPKLEAAARTLGASEWRIFWRITVPLAWPGIAAGLTLAFARSLGEFGATLMLAGNIPGRTQTMPLAIYFAVEAGRTQQALAWVVVVLIISFTSLAVLNYWNASQRRRRQVAALREDYDDAAS
jgi:molybdate transport system permease protein